MDLDQSKGTEDLARLADRLLADITSVLVSEGSPERVLEAVADVLRELVPYDTMAIYRADLARRILQPVLVRDKWAEEILAAGPLQFGKGIVGCAAEQRRAELVNDVDSDPRAEEIAGTEPEQEAMIAVPLLARDELKGMLALYRLGENAWFDVQDLQLATRFASLVALAIDNADIRARLENEVITDHLTGLYNHRYFYERLGEETRRVHRAHLPLSLQIIDIDDFKRANDKLGHLVGDIILQGIAATLKTQSRYEDVVCRIGGEEFAVIQPVTAFEQGIRAAERIRAAVEAQHHPEGEPMTVSIGVASAPMHASSPRELFESADAALRQAKALGKNRVEAWAGEANLIGGHGAGRYGRAPMVARGRDLGNASIRQGERAIAQLKVVHALATRFNQLNNVEEIGSTIATELRSLLDFHNCRVYLMDADGVTLNPVAFIGSSAEYEGETVEALATKVGEGITGRVVMTGEALYLPNAVDCDFAEQIPGTPDIDESILAAPLRYGNRSTGAIVLSKLGVDQFDDTDVLLLETLASHAAVAFENARLYQEQKEAAEISHALLVLSERLTRTNGVDNVLEEALDAIPGMIPCLAIEAWMQEEGENFYRLAAHRGFPPATQAAIEGMTIPAAIAEPFIGSTREPFIIPKEALALGPPEFRRWEGDLDVLGAPMRWDPNGLGGLAIIAPSTQYTFTERDIRLAVGIADIASLALGNAHRFQDLELAYVSTVEALANALEAQDQYTSDHAHALAQMAVAVGATLGLSEAEIKELELTALFHDIGKIGVPSEIIRKPGPLTAGERRIMDRHPEIGEQILAPVSFLQPIRPAIRACHERWDGNGYPDGLAGKGIPLTARIVFVCDAFHAMTSNRPYRAALPDREAIRRLRLAAGTQFDPSVVRVFVRLVADGSLPRHADESA